MNVFTITLTEIRLCDKHEICYLCAGWFCSLTLANRWCAAYWDKHQSNTQALSARPQKINITAFLEMIRIIHRWIDRAFRRPSVLCVCVCVVLPLTLPGTGLTSAWLLPAESQFSSRQWPVSSLGSPDGRRCFGASYITNVLSFDLLVQPIHVIELSHWKEAQKFCRKNASC